MLGVVGRRKGGVTVISERTFNVKLGVFESEI